MRDQSEESHPTRVYALKWTVFLLAVVQKANGGMAARIREKALSLSAASLENERKNELLTPPQRREEQEAACLLHYFFFPFSSFLAIEYFLFFVFSFPRFFFSFFFFL